MAKKGRYMFKTIANDVESEIVEKKSRFITNLFYVESEAEAEQKIKEIRKKMGKTLMLGKIESKRRRGWQRMR